jgi:glycerol-3-phosphate dehydrogenase (NAD(P)+)
MRITVIGAGAWGTALAAVACARAQVTLHARSSEHASAISRQHENTRHLPGFELPHHLRVVDGDLSRLSGCGHGQDLFVVATPMAGLRLTLQSLAHVQVPVVWLCKGFEAGSGLLAHEVQQMVAPHMQAGVLSGPSFAQEVVQGQPAALVAASLHDAVREILVQAFHGPSLRIYANADVVGVEVGGAVKNVLAIATGLCDGLSLGLNARAALITRGLAEMTRLGVALGGRAETFMGLSGLGDLVLTTTGELSRNRRIGLLLAQGNSLQQALDSLGHVAEGVYSARTVAQRARALGVDMPITDAVVALLEGRLEPGQVVRDLMGRDPRVELD